MGQLRGTLLAAAVALGSLLGICATNALASATPPPSTPAAVAYQLNAGHTGVTADSVAASPTKRWSDVFPGGVSYPLIVGSRVYVTVAHASTYGTTLYALQAGTGAKLWSVNLGGTYYWSGLTYAAGRVFTVNYDGVMEAFDAVTGATDWSTQLPDQYAFSSPPTAANGYVYTGGAGEGGTAYAVDQANGVVKWTAPVENGDNSSPAVSASGVYVSYACGQSYDFDPSSGAQIWHRSTACEGGGGKTPVLADGFLFVRDLAYPGVLNASTGAMVAQFTTSGPAPAVDSSQIYDLSDSTLTARSLSSGAPAWSFTGDGTLDSAPLVAGGTVIIGGGSGELYGLSSATGAVSWSTNVGAGIPGPDEQDVSPAARAGAGLAGDRPALPRGLLEEDPRDPGAERQDHEQGRDCRPGDEVVSRLVAEAAVGTARGGPPDLESGLLGGGGRRSQSHRDHDGDRSHGAGRDHNPRARATWLGVGRQVRDEPVELSVGAG